MYEAVTEASSPQREIVPSADLAVDDVVPTCGRLRPEAQVGVDQLGGQLQAVTGDGSITVMGFDGQLEARTGDGSISMDGNFNSVTARTGDGSISLAVPPGSNFTVETNAENTVIPEGLLLTEDVTPTQRVRRWRVGNGGKVFVLNTGDGRIVVRSR